MKRLLAGTVSLTTALLVIGGAHALATRPAAGGPVDLATEANVTITGPSNSAAGIGVQSAGDVNGDGRDDIIVGAENTTAYVIFGGGTQSTVNLASLGTAGFSVTGPGTTAFGWRVSAAGDVNGDGFDDVIVGAFGANNDVGAAWVIYGSASPQPVSISTLGSAGFEIDGIARFDELGSSVAPAGDVNDDGFDDVIVGASTDGAPNPGHAYVIYGSAHPTTVKVATLGSAGFEITGAAPGDFAGSDVAAVGDINGDGRDDLAVGAENANGGTGAAYVIYGSATPGPVSLGDLGSRGFTITGASNGDTFGTSLDAAGDINGDGRADLVIGAPGGGNGGAGHAYVIYGSSAPVDLTAAALGAHGFEIDGAGGFAGSAVAGDLDFDGDGFDDVVIGAPNVNSTNGAAYVVYGSANPAKASLSGLGTRGFVINGATQSYAGSSLAAAGDFDGDGHGDLLIGADGSSGHAYLVDGFQAGPVPTSPPTIIGRPEAGRDLITADAAWENPGRLSVSRQWVRCDAELSVCTPIAGATATTYTPDPSDIGDRLEVLVTAADDQARHTTSRSAATVAVQPAHSPPTVSGTPAFGGTLTCVTTGWSAARTVSWSRGSTVIATGPSYAVVLADVDHALTCHTHDLDVAGVSDATSPPVVISRVVPHEVKGPTITRKHKVLSCHNGTWTGATSFTHQWLRDGEPIKHATKPTFTVRSADRHHLLSCLVTAVSTQGRTSLRTKAYRPS